MAETIELARYYPSWQLEMSWRYGRTVDVWPSDNPQMALSSTTSDPMLRNMALNGPGDESARSITLATLRSLGDYQRQGPVIIRPTVDLCRDLIDTTVRIPFEEYRQPYSMVGMELPRELAGPHWPCLTIAWLIPRKFLLLWTFSRLNLLTYHNLLGPFGPIEDQIEGVVGVADDDFEYNLLSNAGRIIMNLCMLATYRPFVVADLPASVVKHRRRNDERLRELAGRHAQELIFRDLFPRRRPPVLVDSLPGEGMVQGPQLRRYHWKSVHYGRRDEGFMARKRWVWVDEYWTHKDQVDDAPPASTVVLR